MTWWQYLMLVNIYLLLFYGFYILLLKRETFFQLNRIYLVAASMLSFCIPLIQSDWAKSLFITRRMQYTLYTSPVMFYQFKPIIHTQITIGQILVTVYLAGMFFLTARLVWQLLVLKKVINQPQPSVAFSFFKKISVGDELANNQVINAHERAHASQWHSADILFIEAVMIINWFNPVVYLYRFAIKHIHEFIADRQAIKTGTSREDYAMLLLSQTFNLPAHRLVNPFFNQSLLKQRIIMLQKTNSKYVALVKYGLSAPLFMLMLVLSSATVNNSKPIRLFKTQVEQVFLIPAAPLDDVDNAATAIKSPKTRLKTVVEKTNISQFTDIAPANETKVFTAVEQVPVFPGGLSAFSDYLSKNIKYPAESRKNGIQGRVVISFVVQKDGSLTGFKIAKGVEDNIDQEALRVLEASPKWVPGIQNGIPVRVAYSVPIAFALDDANQPQPADNPGSAIDKSASSVQLLPAKEIEAKKDDTLKKGTDLRIDGASAIPLFILDGKEISDLSKVNPNDVQSMEVLKNKAAKELYGVKGTFGVVVITTHKASLATPTKPLN